MGAMFPQPMMPYPISAIAFIPASMLVFDWSHNGNPYCRLFRGRHARQHGFRIAVQTARKPPEPATHDTVS